MLFEHGVGAGFVCKKLARLDLQVAFGLSGAPSFIMFWSGLSLLFLLYPIFSVLEH